MFGSVRTLLVGGVVGKVLAIARELVSATLLGTGVIASAFRLSQAAFVIPLQGLLSDSLSAGFTPTYARERTEFVARSRALFAGMNALLLVSSTGIGALVAVFAAPWVHLLAPGFVGHTAILATQMVQVMACAMPPYAMTALCAAAELASGRAEMAAARASVQSIGLIAGTLLAWVLGSPILIPVGFALSYVWLAGWGVKLVLADKLHLWPSTAEWSESRIALARVWRAFRVIMLVPILMQVHFIIERRVASIVDSNAVAALDYARFISDTAVALLAMPFGMAGLGAMASMSEGQFKEAALRSSRILLFIGMPLSVALGLHTEWIVKIVFARGAFGAASVATTVAILRGLAVGLWSQLIGYAGVKFLSARGNNRAVVQIYIVALGVNIALNLLLEPVLGVSALGIAYAANSLILGLLILMRLGLLKHLHRDLIAITAAAAGYAAIWQIVPAEGPSQRWLPPVFFAAFWAAAGLIIPRCRGAYFEVWRLVKPS